MNIPIVLHKKGVTLVELLAIVVLLMIIGAVSMVVIGDMIERTRLKADQQSVIQLNIATRYFSLEDGGSSIFDVESTDIQKIELLVEEGFLSTFASPQSKDGLFTWNNDLLSWFLSINNETVSLSPYGNTHLEISPHLIQDMQDFYQKNNRYARTWGDYRYTDLGLDVKIWKEPILHILYTPSGSNLFLKPAEGYQFSVWNETGDMYINITNKDVNHYVLSNSYQS